MTSERSQHPSANSPSAHSTPASNSFASNSPSKIDDAPATHSSGAKSENILNRLLGDRKTEWQSLANKAGPLHFLELPVEVLNLILGEVTHTNDLVALSLSHSALHKLAIPHIYSRFDIVWPEATAQSEPRTGVDALTYGLATLVMAEEVFGESPSQRPATCKHCGQCPDEAPIHPTGTFQQQTKKRRGNYYAEFTRKFSLGNGPGDWIKEYLVNTESGKMLGTLVALAIARMRSLESFIWDMPTGILPDVWNALASLGEREGGHSCRLERVWVRWHNNSYLVDGDYVGRPIPHEPHTFWQTQEDIIRDRGEPSKLAAVHKRNKVERPTFSSLPPLKGLSVLDVDECSYLDEMSILVKESTKSLRELRIGIASHAVTFSWNYPSLESDTSQAAQGKSRFTGNISVLEKRLGGVLGVLTAYIFDLKKERAHNIPSVREKESELPTKPAAGDPKADTSNEPENSTVLPIRTPSQRSRARFVEDLPPYSDTPRAEMHGEEKVDPSKLECAQLADSSLTPETQKLRLSVLAMERVSLSVPILAGAFDWTTLTNLTLLDCQFSTTFFSFLRRQYTPASTPHEESKPFGRACFPLNLRKVHINTITPASIAFMRETLAPNSLELLFIQQSEYHLSNVSADKIMSVVKRHRGSLRKILIDSSERDETDLGSPRAVGWDKWLFNRSMLAFVTSGKMPRLRELSVAISYKDWHYLLQRLMYAPQLRALYLPYVAKSSSTFVPGEEAKELAFQVLDILTIRPDIELCYLAIASKCYEIVEGRVKPSDLQLEEESRSSQYSMPGSMDPEEEEPEYGAEEQEEEEEDDDEEASGEDETEAVNADAEEESEAAESSGAEESESEVEDEARSRVKMALREILFYDDKVAIFKARHGRL